MERWDAELRLVLPPSTEVFDAHVHLGHDVDGMVGDYDELEQVQQRYGIGRAFMFCLDEPDREPSFSAANDRTLAFAERSSGRLIPFVRLDLNASPLDEARRCLDAGARGIKLHPRAQGFTASDERLGPVFELAAERRVPILIHGGRGLPPIADGLRSLVDRNPEATLIIAHAGIADLYELARCMAGRKGVVFDTSTWSPVDLLDFYRQVPPEQVVYASDYPYGQQPSSLLIAVKTARFAGCDDAQLRAMLSETASAIADGRELPGAVDAGRARGFRTAAAARAHPPVPLDGDTAALDATAGHDRRPRAGDQHLLRAGRARRGGREDPRAAGGGARPVEDDPLARGRARAATGDAADPPARAHRRHRGGHGCLSSR